MVSFFIMNQFKLKEILYFLLASFMFVENSLRGGCLIQLVMGYHFKLTNLETLR